MTTDELIKHVLNMATFDNSPSHLLRRVTERLKEQEEENERLKENYEAIEDVNFQLVTGNKHLNKGFDLCIADYDKVSIKNKELKRKNKWLFEWKHSLHGETESLRRKLDMVKASAYNAIKTGDLYSLEETLIEQEEKNGEH